MVLRRIMAFILISSLLFPPLIKLGVIADYYKNVEYIASTFCVNKDKPQKKCNGKCHLDKQLAKTEESSTEKSVPLPTLKTELSAATMSIGSPEFFFINNDDNNYSLMKEISYSFLSSFDFFHPPQA